MTKKKGYIHKLGRFCPSKKIFRGFHLSLQLLKKQELGKYWLDAVTKSALQMIKMIYEARCLHNGWL
jgi:hypothetical protein